MMFRPKRAAGSDRFLELRALLLLTGAGFGLAGMLSERSWMVYVGIGIIAAGMVLRLINRRKDESKSDDE
ncbi:MAG TPA: hypothetical protein VF021_03345 [Longimicrobiales bacterium]